MQEKLEKVCTVWTINVVFGQEHSRLGTLDDNFDGPDRTFFFKDLSSFQYHLDTWNQRVD